VQPERAATSDFALYADVSTHLLHYVSSQVKTEAHTRHVGILKEFSASGAVTHRDRVSGTSTMKFVKEDGHVLWWYASSVVGDAYCDLRVFFPGGQHNATTIWCVLNSVLDDV
jgi:hypothetical protein